MRALETYLLNEGADIFVAIREREQAAAGRVVDLSDIIADMDQVVARKEP